MTYEKVLAELRRHHFMTLATTGADGRPHSAGVSYAVSPVGTEMVLYVMTRTQLQKTRDIARESSVAMVVPIHRRVLQFLPPATVQLRGKAQILDWKDANGTDAFEHFWLGRRILAAYRVSAAQGESRICFLRITPEPIIRTYMLGTPIWELGGRMESGAATVIIPQR